MFRRWSANAKDEVAILFLCSKEAKWITGVILPVDAGVSHGSEVDVMR